MLDKVLVANRGEIVIWVFRAAYELGIHTVALYTPDDRDSQHCQKADEVYEIGEAGHPARVYLDVETLVDTALRVGAGPPPLAKASNRLGSETRTNVARSATRLSGSGFASGPEHARVGGLLLPVLLRGQARPVRNAEA